MIEGGDCRADDHATEQITNDCIKGLSGFSSVYEIGLKSSRALELYSSQSTYKTYKFCIYKSQQRYLLSLLGFINAELLIVDLIVCM